MIIKKKHAIITTVFLCILMLTAYLSGCGKQPSEETSDRTGAESATQAVISEDINESGSPVEREDQASDEPLYVQDGVEVTLAEVHQVGKIFNFFVIYCNNSDKDAVFDETKFQLQTKNGDSLTINMTDTIEIKAGTTYLQYAYPLVGTDHLEVGDKVLIYYDGQLLSEVEVTEN